MKSTTGLWLVTKLVFLLAIMVQWTHDNTQQNDYQTFWDKQKKVVSRDTDFTQKLSAPRSMALTRPSIHLSGCCPSTWYDYQGVWYSKNKFRVRLSSPLNTSTYMSSFSLVLPKSCLKLNRLQITGDIGKCTEDESGGKLWMKTIHILWTVLSVLTCGEYLQWPMASRTDRWSLMAAGPERSPAEMHTAGAPGHLITTAPSAWRDHKHHFDYKVLGVCIYKIWPHQHPLECTVQEERSLCHPSPDSSYA